VRRRLRAIVYGLRRATGGAARRPVVTALSVGAIGISLLLVGVVVLAALNVSRLTQSWGRGVQMVVYLEEDTPPERAKAIGEILSAAPAVERVDFVPPDAAWQRLRDSLGDRRDLLDGVEVGFLPSSLEVTLGGGVKGIASVSPMVEKLRRTAGVEEVEFVGDWVERLTSLLATLRALAIALAIVVAAACIYVVAGTIKLGMYARNDELEVLKLVGATDSFVEAPLLVEGAMQGTLGAGVALSLLYLLYRLGAPALERMLGGAVGELDLSFLPAAQVALALGLGAALGVVGSWMAIGRHARA
jgi:cell division transport system permease protein